MPLASRILLAPNDRAYSRPDVLTPVARAFEAASFEFPSETASCYLICDGFGTSAPRTSPRCNRVAHPLSHRGVRPL
jgi:hypothetical protein